MLDYLLLVTGLAILAIGGDNLVRGAVGLAENLGVPHLVIGLTVVAIGTTVPEIFVSLNAALDGVGGLAVGNVIGSNIANILLVLALLSLVRPTPCAEKGVGRNLAVLAGVTLVFMGMLAKGRLERYDGIILLGLLVLFLRDQYVNARIRREAPPVTVGLLTEETVRVPHRTLPISIMIGGGLVALPAGAELTVRAATALALKWGISEEVIGLTVVAVGTSLPELTAGTVAVLRGSQAVALGNIVGANIFNILTVMGLTATAVTIPVADRVIAVDVWVMLAAAALVALFARLRVVIGRAIGIGMLTTYAGYLVLSYSI